MGGASTLTTPRVTADHNLSLTLENTAKLYHLLNEYLTKRPDVPEHLEVATAEYRDRVDAAIVPLQALAQQKKFTNEDAFQAFNKLRGALAGCTIKGSGGLSEEQKAANVLKSEYRKHAQELAEAGAGAFAVPSRRPVEPAHKHLSGEILQKVEDAKAHPTGSYHLAGFLIDKLKAPATLWNSVSLVTALYKLNELDPNWHRRSFAPEVCELAVRRLGAIANREVFSGQSIANLARIVPGLIDATTRLEPRSPQLEKMLFTSLSKALEYLGDVPDDRFADGAFLYPMRDISSRFLTREGAEALCTYVAKLNHLLSQMSHREHLPTVAATFHAMNGISSWAFTPNSDAKLTVMLTNLNDRLSKCTAGMNSITAGSIIYGLKGLDVEHLSPEAHEEVARTIRLVAQGLTRLPPGESLDHAGVSSIVHGLTTSLAVKDGIVAHATAKLLEAVEQRIPRAATRMDEVGALAGALVTLKPNAERYPSLCEKLFSAIAEPSTGRLTYYQGESRDKIAWQVLQQAYALHGVEMPESIQRFITNFEAPVVESRRQNLSEQRIEAYLKEYPNATLLNLAYQDGFEIDLVIRVGQTIVNVEVDGGYHDEPAKRIADAQRDEHLQSKLQRFNFTIVRVPSNASQEHLFKALDEALVGEG